MASKKELSKEDRIKKEYGRLKKIYKELDKNKLDAVDSLIKNAAWMSVTLEDLQNIIDDVGYVDEYQNGANQFGKKQSEEMKTHIAMTKNLSTIMKTLADLTPPAKKAESKLQALRDEE